MLRLRVPLGAGESATSFCSRLAFRNKAPSASEFCLDLGLTFQSVIEGCQEALRSLARLGGVDFDQLWRSALRRDRGYAACGDNEVSVALRRSPAELLVCTSCLADDAQEFPHLGHAAFYGRTAWLIRPIRNCVKHARALVNAGSGQSKLAARAYPQHDFSVRLLPQVEAIIDQAVEPPVTAPSDFERYLVNRLEGGPCRPGFWPDSMPFYQVVRAAEAIGALSTFGPKCKMKELTQDQKLEAGAVGFSVLAEGPEGFRRCLVDSLDLWPKMPKDFVMPGANFGPLYGWLRDQLEDPASDQLRDILRDVLISSRPLGPRVTIFGSAVPESQVHSVWTVAKQFGIQPRQLHRLMHKMGFLDDAALKGTPNMAVFPMNGEAAEFLERLGRSMSSHVAADYIGVRRSVFDRLREAELIRPFISLPQQTRGGQYFFDRSDLDAFLDNLLAQHPIAAPDETGLKPLSVAAKSAKSSLVPVIQMLLGGQIRRVRIASGVRKLDALLLDPAEIRTFAKLPDLRGMTLEQAAQRMGWRYETAGLLTGKGILESSVVRNPVTKLPQRIVSTDALSRFNEEYVALTTLSAQRRISPQKLKLRFDALGVCSAFDRAEAGAVFYRRRDILDSGEPR